MLAAGLKAGTWFGDFFALGAAFTLALALTLSRKSQADMSLAPGLGGLVVGHVCPADGDLFISRHLAAGRG